VTTRPAPVDHVERWWPPLLAGACSTLAGAIHLVVAPEHLEEAWYLGAFFVVVGIGQLALGMLLTRPLPGRLLVVAVFADAAVVWMYVASRTVDLWFLPPHAHAEHLPVAGGVGNGIPIQPGDRIEAVGSWDLVCLAAELVLITVLMALMPAQLRSRTGTALVVLALGVAVALTALGTG
jgi:hypothetical protein